MPTVRQAVIIVVGLCALVAVAYAQLGRHEFVAWDDPDYLTENPHVQRGLTGETFRFAFTAGHAGNWHPLTWLSHAVDWSLWGNDAGKHHLANAAVHAGAAVLLFFALVALAGTGPEGDEAGRKAVWPSALVAALFAAHPLHVESVAWASERKDTLCALFWMAGLWAYAWYVRAPSWGRMGLVGACLALALLSKPMAVTLPAVLLLLDYWPLGRLERPVKRRERRLTARDLVVEKMPLVVLVAISAVLTFVAQSRGGAVATTEHVSLGNRLCNAIVSYAEYLRLTFWPRGLAFFYPLDVRQWGTGAYLLKVGGCLALLIAVTLVAWWLRRARPYVLVGWLWYLGTLVPVIGLVQVGSQAMADRYTYVPLVGIFIALAWGAADIVMALPKLRLPVTAAAAAMVALCTWGSWRQAQVWANSETLFEHARQATERNYMALSALAQVRLNQHRNDEALALLQEALEINPHSFTIHHRLGIALAEPPRNDWGAARGHFEEAVRRQPNNVKVRVGLARVLLLLGEFPAALEQYRTASTQPGFAAFEKEYRDAQARAEQARALLAKAKDDLDRAPNDPQAICQWGRALVAGRRFGEARGAFERALGVDGKCVAAHLGLASLAMAEQKPAAAAAAYRAALRLVPGDASITNNLAWLLATSTDEQVRDGKAALTLLHPLAASPLGKTPEYLDTLAAAHAAAGDFEAAVAEIGQALELARAAGRTDLVTSLARRQESYRQRRAYHE